MTSERAVRFVRQADEETAVFILVDLKKATINGSVPEIAGKPRYARKVLILLQLSRSHLWLTYGCSLVALAAL